MISGEYGNTYYIVIKGIHFIYKFAIKFFQILGEVFCMIQDPEFKATKEKYLLECMMKRKTYFSFNPYTT